MKFLRRLLPLLFLAVLLTGVALVVVNRDYLRDQMVLRSYTAPQDVALLASDTAMSEYGRRLFFVNKPELNDKAGFNTHCQNLSDEAAVLGCFKGNRQGIYIFDVTDPRLHGIEQVTAAHEMLHQAYDRLDGATRQRINKLLEDYYRTSLSDQSVKEKMAIYQTTEPGNLSNEMHSIFGTEIKNLPAELEEYYKRYFTDRQKVVAFRDSSQMAFDSYRKQIADYDKRLADLKPRIDQIEAILSQEVAQLKATKAELEADLAAGRISEYNAGVGPYNALVSSYNKDLADLNRRIEEYNKLVQERNALSVQVSELNEALDSSLTPQ
ncbi:MAG TPA: hypothetical protein VFB59_00425 [Candidatus Saccharimonadales bacterium]|nr:hypothetical protein [Candidatus Saccharimonadales bacterium]